MFGEAALLRALCLLPGLIQFWRNWRAYPETFYGPNRGLVVHDYLNIWAAGTLARTGRLPLVFQPDTYAAWLRSLFGDRLDLYAWAYPPHLLLLAMPFSTLGLVPGFLAWTAAGAALLWGVLRAAGLGSGYALAVVLSPAVFENALIGQNGVLVSGVALAGGLLVAPTRPVLAGALLGLLTLKPQLGLLVPIALVAGREWRIQAAAAAFGALYCVAALAAFGWQSWVSYATVTGPWVSRILSEPFGLYGHLMMVPPFITARALGAGLTVAATVQSLATAGCAAWTWIAWSPPAAPRERNVALLLCLAPLATPYAHNYDLVGVAVACVLLARAAAPSGLGTAARLGLGLAWVWPGLAVTLALRGLPGTGGVALLIAAVTVWRWHGGARDGAVTQMALLSSKV